MAIRPASIRLRACQNRSAELSELAGSPILDASGIGSSWNESGMHTLDRIDDALSVVDGKSGTSIWSIGFYQDQ